MDSPGQWPPPQDWGRRRGGRDRKSWVKAEIAFHVLKVSGGTVISKGGALSDVCKGRGRDSRQGLPVLSKPSLGSKYLPCLRNSSGKDVILQASKHLDLFPKPIIAALLVEDYTTKHVNRKMFYTK